MRLWTQEELDTLTKAIRSGAPMQDCFELVGVSASDVWDCCQLAERDKLKRWADRSRGGRRAIVIVQEIRKATENRPKDKNS
jgi:hypothetical protein